jgi:hypothetical protein
MGSVDDPRVIPVIEGAPCRLERNTVDGSQYQIGPAFELAGGHDAGHGDVRLTGQPLQDQLFGTEVSSP